MNADERRSKKLEFPTADDHGCTPEQRRVIDARLAASDEDIKQGRVYGPFETHSAFLASLRREGAKLRRRRQQ